MPATTFEKLIWIGVQEKLKDVSLYSGVSDEDRERVSGMLNTLTLLSEGSYYQC